MDYVLSNMSARSFKLSMHDNKIQKKSLVFRCDASSTIGFGHVVRCLSLADELQERYGCKIFFAMRTDKIGFQYVQDHGYSVIFPTNPKDFDYESWITEVFHVTNADTLILDVRDNLPRTILKKLKAKKVLIVTIDDPSDRRLDADLAFYPPVPQVNQIDWKGFKGELYIGWEWVLLREEFVLKRQRPNNKTPVILITMGGSDPQGMTLFAVKAIEMLSKNVQPIIALGNGFRHHEELAKLLENAQHHHEIRKNVKKIAQLMASVDLAVASFGVTAYELAAIGVPSILLCLTEDHSTSASAFANAGIAINMGRYDHVSNIKLSDTIGEILYNDGPLLKMRQSLSKLPLFNGTKNISKLIVEK